MNYYTIVPTACVDCEYRIVPTLNSMAPFVLICIMWGIYMTHKKTRKKSLLAVMQNGIIKKNMMSSKKKNNLIITNA